MKKLLSWLKGLIQKKPKPPAPQTQIDDSGFTLRENERLTSENEALRREIQFVRGAAQQEAQAVSTAETTAFLNTIAIPACRLISLLDRNLIDPHSSDGARKVCPIVEDLRKRLIESHVSIIGPAGHRTTFDDALHRPNIPASLLPETEVEILVVGMKYNGLILSKASVKEIA